MLEQTEKVLPFFTGECAFSQHVCELVVGVNVFDLNIGVQTDSVEQTIQCHSVGS